MCRFYDYSIPPGQFRFLIDIDETNWRWELIAMIVMVCGLSEMHGRIVNHRDYKLEVGPCCFIAASVTWASLQTRVREKERTWGANTWRITGILWK